VLLREKERVMNNFLNGVRYITDEDEDPDRIVQVGCLPKLRSIITGNSTSS
jgi:hypothetical protein